MFKNYKISLKIFGFSSVIFAAISLIGMLLGNVSAINFLDIFLFAFMSNISFACVKLIEHVTREKDYEN